MPPLAYYFGDPTRVSLAIGFLIAALATVGAFVQLYDKAYAAWQTDVTAEAAKQLADKAAEVERRDGVLQMLRDYYRMSNDGISTEIIMGKAWPPDDWMNAQLQKDGETFNFQARGAGYQLTN